MSNPASEPLESDAAVPPEKAAVWEDFVDIFFAPSSVFARRERGSIAVPLFAVTVLIGLITVLNFGAMGDLIDAEMQRAMARAGATTVPPDQMEAMRGMQGVFAAVGAFLGPPIMILLVGLTLWFSGKIVDARQTLHAALVVSAYAFVPRVIESVLMGLQARMLDPTLLDGMNRIRLSPARLLDPDTTPPVTIALLGRIDLFVIWTTILLAIGIAVTGRITPGQAAIAAIIVWLVGGLGTLLPALVQS